MTTIPADIRNRVQLGARYLDLTMPGWAFSTSADAVLKDFNYVPQSPSSYSVSLLPERARGMFPLFKAAAPGVPEVHGGKVGLYAISSGDHAPLKTAWSKVITRRRYLKELRARRKAGLTPGTAHLKVAKRTKLDHRRRETARAAAA